MLESSALLISLLAWERHADGPAASAITIEPFAFPSQEIPLITAAMALAVGEPKRALRTLEEIDGPGAIAEAVAALRYAALILDLNWYPGGNPAYLSSADRAHLNRNLPPMNTKSDLHLAARFLLQRLVACAVGEASRTTGNTATLGRALDDLRGSAFLFRGRQPAARLAAQLAIADVNRRAGRAVDTRSTLAATRRRLSAQDLLGHAAVELAEGDFALAELSHPELLSLELRIAPALGQGYGAFVPKLRPPSDPMTAEAHYAIADRLYARSGASSGRAAVALRRAHIARLTGDRRACTRWLQAARDNSSGALTALVTVHEIVDRLIAGDDVPRNALDSVAHWSSTDGSTSFCRGLVRLLLECSEAWQAVGEALPALRCLRLAGHFAAAMDAPVESELVDHYHIRLIDQFTYRRASAVLLAAESARSVASLCQPPVEERAWQRASSQVMMLNDVAEGLADPDFKAVAVQRLADIEAAFSRIDTPSPDAFTTHGIICNHLRQAKTLVGRYRGRRAETAGLREDSQAYLEAALAEATADGDIFLIIVMLAELGRLQEARRLALETFRENGLHPSHAVTLFLLLGDPQSARRALALIDPIGWVADPEKPWVDKARRAELAEAFGEHAVAADLASAAVAEYEHRTARLVRDVLRTSATDDVNVANMYQTAVLAYLGLARERGAGGHSDEAVAFELSDRCRGMAVDLLSSLDTICDPASLDAARRWLRASSAWAATYEDLFERVVESPNHPPTPEQVRAELQVAEELLDVAESDVARLAPQLLAGRQSSRRPAALDDIQAGLADDAVLLMYEMLPQTLLVWVVDSSSVRHRMVPARHRDLACDARQLHAACAAGRSAEREARELAELLIAPVADAIEGHRRLYIVPHRALTLVPFHVLPLQGQLLGERFTLSFLPSASLLARPAAGRPPRLDGPALLVGDPAIAPSRGLPRLPGTATEVSAIADLLDTGRLLLGSAASNAGVARSAPGCTIVHLATHGLVYERSPNRNLLALAGDDELTVGELMGSNLGADLVVLSACHTGRGTATAGGDIVGLARAAISAGARHLVVSLWPVDDEAGCLLMTFLYEALMDPRPGCTESPGVAASLATAQLRLRCLDADGRRAVYEQLRARAHTGSARFGTRDGRAPSGVKNATSELPYYWAPFIHIGG
ncbi:CHAT domain-containing protein [Streptomyces cinerochromogenes]|uniref:CHAT domain-containing protein n=1 Tax=Streptomyces cinerochromogenes TaxID=66422 RepID=A0ABW7BHZ8_9ACTN